MEERIRRLRVRLKTLSQGRVPRGLRYPAEVRDEIVRLAGEAGSPSAVAQALGVPVGTIVRWGRPRAGQPLRRIAIAAEPPAIAASAPPTLVLLTPDGWRVEGLDVATLLAVLQGRA
jgi:transposase-like protein